MGSLIRTAAGTLLSGALLSSDTKTALDYLTSVGVTLTPIQIIALDRLVRDLHGEENPSYPTSDIWSKSVAIYPFIGGTAAAHRMNLLNPALHLLTFVGGMVHSVTGTKWDGSTGYAHTDFNAAGHQTYGASYYSRTSYKGGVHALIASFTGGSNLFQIVYVPGEGMFHDLFAVTTGRITVPTADTVGLLAMSRVSSTDMRAYANGVQIGIQTANMIDVAPTPVFHLGANSTTNEVAHESFSPTECAYADFHLGLTPTEELNRYNAVQAYQVTLGRPFGVVSTEAQAFFDAVTANGGSLTVGEMSAVETLITDLKANGTWAKKFAIYPFVGSSAAAHAINLRNPALYKLTFTGTVTHSLTGMTTAGSGSWADTGIVPNAVYSGTSGMLSYYSRTTAPDATNSSTVGASDTTAGAGGPVAIIVNNPIGKAFANFGDDSYSTSIAVSNGLGWITGVRDGGNTVLYKNGAQILSAIFNVPSLTTRPLYIGTLNSGGVPLPTGVSRECAYADFGGTHTAANITADYAAIQKFQIALDRAVNIAVHADTQAALDYLATVGTVLPNSQVTLLDRHVRDLHGEPNPNNPTTNLWPLIRAAYPFIGGTAASHTLNLRNPAQPLAFSGSMTHSATGCLFQGGYADTTLTMTSQPILAGIGVYCRTAASLTTSALIGSATSAVDQILIYRDSGSTYSQIYGGATGFITAQSGQGYLTCSRISATDFRQYRNGVQTAGTTTPLAESPSSLAVYIGGLNTPSGNLYPANYECAYAQINTGLNPTEENRYWLSMFEYQKGLGRGVTTLFDPSFIAATIAIITLLLSLGIVLTYDQQVALNELMMGTPAPAPDAAPAKKTRKKVKTKIQQVHEYLTSIGVEVDISKLQFDE